MYSFASRANYLCWNTEFLSSEEEFAKTSDWNPFSSLMFAFVGLLKGVISGDETFRESCSKRFEKTKLVLRQYRSKPKKLEELATRIMTLNKTTMPFQPKFLDKAKLVIEDIAPKEWLLEFPYNRIEMQEGDYLRPIVDNEEYNFINQLEMDLEVIEAMRLLFLAGNEFQSGSFLKGAYHTKGCFTAFKKLYKVVKRVRMMKNTNLSTSSAPPQKRSKHQYFGNLDKIHPEIEDRILFGYSFLCLTVQLLPPIFKTILAFVLGSDIFQLDTIPILQQQKTVPIIGMTFFVLGANALFLPTGLEGKDVKLKEFIPILHNFIVHFPESLIVDWFVSKFALKLGQFDTVVRRLEDSLERHKETSALLINLRNELGMVYFNLRDWEKVEMIFGTIVETTTVTNQIKFQFLSFISLQLCVTYCGLDKKKKFYEAWKDLLKYAGSKTRFSRYVAPYLTRLKKKLDPIINICFYEEEETEGEEEEETEGEEEEEEEETTTTTTKSKKKKKKLKKRKRRKRRKKKKRWKEVKSLFLYVVYFEILYLRRDLDAMKEEDVKKMSELYQEHIKSVEKLYRRKIDPINKSPELLRLKFEKLLLFMNIRKNEKKKKKDDDDESDESDESDDSDDSDSDSDDNDDDNSSNMIIISQNLEHLIHKMEGKVPSNNNNNNKKKKRKKKCCNKAITTFKLEKDWTKPYAQFELAELYYEQKEYSKALLLLKRCRKQKNFAWREVLRARAVVSQKQVEQAVILDRKLLRDEKNNKNKKKKKKIKKKKKSSKKKMNCDNNNSYALSDESKGEEDEEGE